MTHNKYKGDEKYVALFRKDLSCKPNAKFTVFLKFMGPVWYRSQSARLLLCWSVFDSYQSSRNFDAGKCRDF